MLLRLGLFLLFLFGIHSRLRLFSGETLLVPSVIAFIIGIMFCFIHAPKYLNPKFKVLFLLILFFAASIFWGPNAFNSLILKEKFLGFIQIFTSIIISYSIFWELKKYDKTLLSKIFLFIFCFLLLGSLVEIFTPFKFFMEDIMRPMYPPDAFYYSFLDTIERDSSYYLLYRPKFLTSEPSYLGESASLLILFWRLSTNNPFRNFYYILFFFIAFIIIRSPVLFTLIPIYFLINYIYDSSKKNVFVNIGSIVLIILFSLFSFNVMKERIVQASYGFDNSLTMRIIAPTLITYEILNQHPFLGVGIEAKEATENIILEKFAQLGLTNYLEVNKIEIQDLVHKNHSYSLKFFAYFGILGMSIIIILLRKIMLQHGVGKPLFIFLILFILGFTQGNVTGINTWTYFFILCRLVSSK